MRILASDLREAFNRILTHLEATGRREFDITEEFYWSIPPESRYDTYERPSELTVGQLSEDWDWIEKINRGESEPLGYALVWLARILTVVGQKAVE